jgi:hypothetical protein
MAFPTDWPKDPVGTIAAKYGWDRSTTLKKIRRTKELLGVDSIIDAVDFLLATIVPQHEISSQ